MRIMNKEEFSEMIERQTLEKNATIMEVLTEMIHEGTLDYEDIKKLLNDKIKTRIKSEAIELHIIKADGIKNKLPL